ncbi:MAG: hypothetical protein ABSB23_13990 [Bryobacteraceae bacterium]|jgi:hypothetical protein
MVSGKLIHLIETNEGEITNRIMAQIRRDPDLTHLRMVTEGELRRRSSRIVKNLGHWLVGKNQDEIAKEFETVGMQRFEEGVPLHEVMRALFFVKNRMVDFIAEQGFNMDALTLYAEEELERRVDRFFDLLVIHLARGYESRWHRAMNAAA